MMAIQDFLTDAEIKKIITAIEVSFTQTDAELTVNWARGVRIASGTLDAVLAGKIVISGFEDGEPVFGLGRDILDDLEGVNDGRE